MTGRRVVDGKVRKLEDATAAIAGGARDQCEESMVGLDDVDGGSVVPGGKPYILFALVLCLGCGFRDTCYIQGCIRVYRHDNPRRQRPFGAC